jgi:ubiquinone/menaquinone biosynthesis C-methylase UbiE
VGKYTGVDLSSAALAVARRLRLPNATFRVADGGRLPFAAGQFNGAFCYDVFTNFPDFETGAPIIAEMLRVVKPGSRVLIGSIPDAATKAAYEARTVEVGAELEARFGRVVPPAPRPPTLGKRLRDLLRTPAEPVIVCYYFERADFEALARSLGCTVTITDIHPKNPYFGYRFNAIYTKPA